MGENLETLTEDELDVLVSNAIYKAEHLPPSASRNEVQAAWKEVMLLEAALAAVTSPYKAAGWISRIGAISAAKKAGMMNVAASLCKQYESEAHHSPRLAAEMLRVLKRKDDFV